MRGLCLILICNAQEKNVNCFKELRNRKYLVPFVIPNIRHTNLNFTPFFLTFVTNVILQGEKMEIEHRVMYSNQTKPQSVLSTPNTAISPTTENVNLKLEDILESYKRKQQNSETKKSNGR